jgi:hypothetical protein
MSAASNSGFAGTVSLSCGNAPTKATCSANPANVTLTSNGNATFTVSVTTTANSFMTYDRRIWPSLRGPWTGLLYGLALLSLVLAILSRTTRRRLVLAGGAVLMLLLAGCGGGSSSPPTNNGTPAGTYTISVSGSAQGTTQAMNVTLVVQ